MRGVCLVVKDRDRTAASRAITRFPRRPERAFLSESIPLFFIARNANRLWVAREAEGRSGGIFLFKRDALRFAAEHGAAAGCATMFLNRRFELDVKNCGSVFAAALDSILRTARARSYRIGGAIAAIH